jgi:2',3'-cyclic-nucleotide 2'-phosphodiesterase (5'-nucleotidase family)
LLASCQQASTELFPNQVQSSFIAVKLDSSQSADAQMEAIIAPYRNKMDSAMSEVVVISAGDYARALPNGKLNNLISDIMLQQIQQETKVHIDFCLLNYGGLRRPLPKGEVIKSDIYQLMPFENEAVLVKLSPKGMQQMFSYIHKCGGQPVSGIELHYSDSTFISAKIQGKDYNPQRSYWVLTSDYTANGGDQMDFFAQRDSTIVMGTLLREAMFGALHSLHQQGDKLVADSTDRIYFTQHKQ